MRELNNKELMNIEGGASLLTATFLNAAARMISTIMDVGRSLGTSIRRITSGNTCSI